MRKSLKFQLRRSVKFGRRFLNLRGKARFAYADTRSKDKHRFKAARDRRSHKK